MKIKSVFFLFLLWSGCRHLPGNNLIVENEKLFDSIPSASGIAIKNEIAYIVSDDGTGIYKIDLKNFHQEKIPIAGLAFNEYREDKSIKHDFESACFATWQNREYLVAIGSGSGSARDSMLMLNTGDYADQKIYSLKRFYQQLLLTTSTDSAQLNMEGLTIAGDSLIFLNRGNNLMLTCNVHDFFSFLVNGSNRIPEIRVRKVALPAIEKHEARFSGICTIDEKRLLFCASVENTPDWTKDGPVLGSYFGIYSLENGRVVATYLLKDREGKAIKEKIESVDILQNTKRDLIFLATVDNDNGSSKLFQLRLKGFKRE